MLQFSSVFFFSSRRRHTRWPRNWSSDVCSSDLSCLLRSDDAAVAQRRQHLIDGLAVIRVPALDQQIDLLAGGHRGRALHAGGDIRAGGDAAGPNRLQVLPSQQAWQRDKTQLCPAPSPVMARNWFGAT